MALSSSPWQPIHRLWTSVAFGAILASLLLTSLHSYLLFHVLAETFAVVVSFAMFTIFWNSRRFLNDNWLILLSIGFLSAGLLGLLHMLAYNGMGVFQADANLATQLWIATRYVEGSTLLAAMLIRNHRIRTSFVFILYGAVTAALIAAIFTDNFPACFSPENGLTRFKVFSEGVICMLLILSLAPLIRHRHQFTSEVFRLLTAAIVMSVFSELAFCVYTSVTDWLNAAGHLLRFSAVFLLYKIFVEQGLRQPFSLLFRDLKHREDALRESEEEMRLITDSLPALISYIDADGYYRFANKAYEEWFGKGVVGRHAKDVLGDEVYATLSPYVERALRGKTVTYTRAVSFPAGARHIQATYVPRFDEKRHVVGFFALVHDISKRVRAEEALRTLTQTLEERVLERTADLQRSEQALRESDERLSLALVSAGIGTWDWNIKERFIHWDDYVHPLFGLAPGVFRGRQNELLKMVHPDDRSRVRTVLAHALASGEPLDHECRIVWPDGTVHFLATRGKVRHDDAGRPVRMSGVSWDVTERKRLEAALRQSERLAAIGQMISGLSHESRNALQRNRACIEMLTRRLKNNPEVLPLLEEAAKAQADLQRVHDEVRDYSGPFNLELAPQPVSEIWNEAWSNLEPLRQGKNAVLVEDTEATGTVCLVDRFRMRQVFRNLLENSLAACGESAEIHITCANAELNGSPARKIVLRDNGPGLNPEQAERIFEPFYTTKTKGTGLGMAIVKRIIESHGGLIKIIPGPGQGLEVILHLPSA